MPPLSQLMQMAPGNVFGGLGKGLGAGVGGGITKQIRRPLFNKLVDKFRTGNEDKARLNTLAQMGVSAAPMEGSAQYPIFQQMMEANQGLLNQRANRAQELWETDPEAAREYLLDEQAMKFGGGKGPKGKDVNPMLEPTRQALIAAEQNLYKAGFALAETGAPEDWDALEQAKLGLIEAKSNYAGAGGDPNKVVDSASQQMTTVKTLQDLRNTLANIKGKNTGTRGGVLDKIYATIDKVLAKPRINKWIDEAAKVRGSQTQIQDYIANFDQIKTQPNILFGVIKELGKAIEPGLQVTSEEVKGFLGANAVSSFIGGVQELGESAKALFGSGGKGGLLREAQAAAATDQPAIMWKILVQASHVISNAQANYGEFLYGAQENAKNIMGPDSKARMMDLSPDEQATVKAAAEAYVKNQLSELAKFSQMQPIPYGTSMPADGTQYAAGDTEDPNYVYEGPQTYPDGTEVSTTDSQEKLKANAKLYKENPAAWGPAQTEDLSIGGVLTDVAQEAAGNVEKGIQYKNIPSGGFN